MSWPTRFSNLNSIKNLWILLAKDVYRNARQYTKFHILYELYYFLREVLESLKINNVSGTECVVTPYGLLSITMS